jgi:protein-disulfide isomerase
VKKAARVASKFPGGEVKVEIHEALSAEGEKYGVLLTPTVIVNGKVIAAGAGFSEKGIEKYVRQHLEKPEAPA